jgi:hypothetical protein
MNNREREVFARIAVSYSHVHISVNQYIDWIGKAHTHMVDWVMDANILKNGRFCTIFGASCWVNNSIADGYIRVSNHVEPTLTDDTGWSPPIKLEDFERLSKLKVFW